MENELKTETWVFEYLTNGLEERIVEFTGKDYDECWDKFLFYCGNEFEEMLDEYMGSI